MDSGPRLSPRERWTRIVGGLAVVAAGCVIFGISKAKDPANRGAIVGILAILGGLSWLGQGLRGRREGATHREPPPHAGPPISAERTVLGVLLGWIVPGLGHWLIGRRGKAVLYFVTITLTFLAGVALAQGRNLSYERDDIYFLAYMFNAGETALGWLLTHSLELDRDIPFLQLGFLYTAVACLLNLVALMDFVSTCGRSLQAPEAEAASAAAPEEPASAAGEEGRP